MAKALDVNENTAPARESQPQLPSGPVRDDEAKKPKGKALQVNENTVGNPKPARDSG